MDYRIAISGHLISVGCELFSSPEELSRIDYERYSHPRNLMRTIEGIAIWDEKMHVSVTRMDGDNGERVVYEMHEPDGIMEAIFYEEDSSFPRFKPIGREVVLWVSRRGTKADLNCKGIVRTDVEFNPAKLKFLTVESDGALGSATVLTGLEYDGAVVEMASTYDEEIAFESPISFLETAERRYRNYDINHVPDWDEACMDSYQAMNYGDAFKYAELGTLFGRKQCQCLLGVMYLKGLGARKNPTKAIENLKASAAKGCSKAKDILRIIAR